MENNCALCLNLDVISTVQPSAHAIVLRNEALGHRCGFTPKDFEDWATSKEASDPRVDKAVKKVRWRVRQELESGSLSLDRPSTPDDIDIALAMSA